MSDEKKTLSGGQLAVGNSTTDRAAHDFYATDPETVRLFLDTFTQIEVIDGDILECACGQGHMAKILEEYYPNNKVIGTDIVDRGYGRGGIDFLTHEFDQSFHTIITNPPFSLAKEFISRGLELSDKYVIMLCKIQLLEGIKRKELFLNTPLHYIFVHTTRQATWKEGNPTDPKGNKWATTMCLAWFVWDKDYVGEPVIKWI